MAKKSDIKNYDEAVKELEEILQLLENNELKIDDLTQKAKRATELVEYCKEKLRKTTEELDEIMKS
ncbi:MAG: exodeoxyribonuclease VII small subunit [Paludibacteraceae bacterium]|mgnify:FL=1|jgi:exodeoxyribonuclease VII small subunit|nr:exodeoxyribonuclease VII small subunit [Paludibacteraceae bacterium]